MCGCAEPGMHLRNIAASQLEHVCAGSQECVSTLNVIVERAILVTVLVEQTECVDIGKVFKLNETVHAVPVGS